MTKRHLFGIIKMQRAKTPELIFVRRPRGHLWDKTYFAYVVKFVRIVLFGLRELFVRNAHVVIFYAVMSKAT